MSTHQNAWTWETTDPLRSGSSGDLSKLFRNESVKQPGIFARSAPSAGATLLAREVIQNSWDAARDARESAERDGRTPTEFNIDFTFRELSGQDKTDLVDNLDLRSLATRSAESKRSELGLGESDCLLDLGSTEPLSVLQISETGTTGMYGPFTGASSKLYLALISIGYTAKLEGSGGSYGYGKAGLIRASATRTVVAYTCFRERSDDPGVTRRLLGMTYWGQHGHHNASFTGFARFGSSAGEGVQPFVNEEADEIADSLGMARRSTELDDQLGTTFLLIEPSVTAPDVTKAIERNWWPAIVEGHFLSTVRDAQGTLSRPRPKKNADLKPFIRAFEVASTPQDNSRKEERQTSFQAWTSPKGDRLELGDLGIVAEMDGWSWASDFESYGDDDGEQPSEGHRSLVALVRGPRMIVEYLDVGRQAPFVRGVFIAHSDVDDLLRQSEPKAHDAWQTRIGDGEAEKGINSVAPAAARVIMSRIRTNVRAFRNTLKPPVPKPEDVRLPLLRELFRDLMDGAGPDRPPPPPPPPREVSIRVEQALETAGDGLGLIRMRATVTYSLSDHVKGDTAPVVLGLSYKFIEDGRSGQRCALKISAPDGFNRDVDGRTFTGALTREPATFSVASAAYSADWTAQLVASGELATPAPVAVGVEVST